MLQVADQKLEPETGIRVESGRFVAVATPFWLRIDPVSAIARHRWVRIRYSSSFLDEPVRPLIRFTMADGRTSIQAMNGPVLGCGAWIGRVPPATVAVSISPGRRMGPFAFRIDDIEAVSVLTLLQRAFRRDPGRTLWAIQSRCLGAREEGWQALRYACGGIDLAHYHDWHARLARPAEPDGLDSPRTDWTTAPQIGLAIALTEGGVSGLESTLASCRAQLYPRWTMQAAAEGAAPELLAAYRTAMARDERLLLTTSDDTAAGQWHAAIGVDDTMPAHALAAVAEHIAANPGLAVVYTDEDAIGGDGTLHSPVLKPDWSPILHERAPYVGNLCCIRATALADAGRSRLRDILEQAETLRAALERVERHQVGHVARPLYRRRTEPPREQDRPSSRRRPEPQLKVGEWPAVDIVIPTRDCDDLLAHCLDGLKTSTDYPNFSVIIVDNGSTQPEALVLLRDIQSDPRFTVIERPGPFNFSKLSNDGAHNGSAPLLLFLNNDIEIIDPGWLTAMARWAMRPDIGVVGARLLFPNRTVQHAGVTLGMGGFAGHVYRQSPPDRAGYLSQLVAAREVMAVTGACMAIERTKFEAAGGFDSNNLPIDLNDIDLCLRVAERGWVNVCIPEAELIHLQSASRGEKVDSFELYKTERSYFLSRWSEAIRDDPYFHPAFELFAKDPALG